VQDDVLTGVPLEGLPAGPVRPPLDPAPEHVEQPRMAG
jgi:hypothetical protein